MKTKEQVYREDLRAWRVLAAWWVLCYVVGVVIVWTHFPVGFAVVVTVWVSVMYPLAIGIPMYLKWPVHPEKFE